jgi:hypothetical protein
MIGKIAQADLILRCIATYDSPLMIYAASCLSGDARYLAFIQASNPVRFQCVVLGKSRVLAHLVLQAC